MCVFVYARACVRVYIRACVRPNMSPSACLYGYRCTNA